jgi:hypothetical protein
MKTNILNSRSVNVKLKLSELLAGLTEYQSELYLCMVVHRMAGESLGIGGHYMSKFGAHQIAQGHFHGITTQMLEQFAPLLGIEVDYWHSSSIKGWASEGIYKFDTICHDWREWDIEGDKRDWYEIKTVKYRQVLLERLIYEKGDVELSFVLRLRDDNPNSFALFV